MNRACYKASFLFLAAGLGLGGCKTPSTKPVQPEAAFYPAKLEAIDAAIVRAIAAGTAMAPAFTASAFIITFTSAFFTSTSVS